MKRTGPFPFPPLRGVAGVEPEGRCPQESLRTRRQLEVSRQRSVDCPVTRPDSLTASGIAASDAWRKEKAVDRIGRFAPAVAGLLTAMALGAARDRILRSVMGQACAMTGAGVVIGGLVAAAGVRVIRGMLYGIAAQGAGQLGVAAVGLVAVTTDTVPSVPIAVGVYASPRPDVSVMLLENVFVRRSQR